eukprot:363150-Chlamydomonas_euryale.AAC.2
MYRGGFGCRTSRTAWSWLSRKRRVMRSQAATFWLALNVWRRTRASGPAFFEHSGGSVQTPRLDCAAQGRNDAGKY